MKCTEEGDDALVRAVRTFSRMPPIFNGMWGKKTVRFLCYDYRLLMCDGFNHINIFLMQHIFVSAGIFLWINNEDAMIWILYTKLNA